jgi:hypothetical protein
MLALLSACTNVIRGHGALDTNLHCPPGAVTDHGAPFCYALPDGFTDDSALDTYGTGWTYRTLVAVAPKDLVEVLAARLPFDSDTYSDGQLLNYAQGRLTDAASSAQRTLAGVNATWVAGARAYQQTLNISGGATERAILAYRGYAEVYIQCLQREKPQAAQAGCARVLDTIQIIDLP